MANGPRRSVNYTPRMTDMEAVDACHPATRKALLAAAFDWSAYSIYRFEQKHGWKAAVAEIARWDSYAMNKRPWMPGTPSPCKSERVPPLAANW